MCFIFMPAVAPLWALVFDVDVQTMIRVLTAHPGKFGNFVTIDSPIFVIAKLQNLGEGKLCPQSTTYGYANFGNTSGH